MTATFAAFTHAAHRSTAFAAPPRSGVMAETAPTPELAFAAGMATVAAAALIFSVFVKSKHHVFLRFHAAKIYL